MRKGPWLVGFALFLAGAPHAMAAEPEDDALQRRLTWVERVIDREATATRVWKGGWVGVFAGAAALEAILASVSSQPNVRVDSTVNASKAFIAFGFTLLLPAHAGPVADRARRMPRATPADRAAKLRFLETQLAMLAEEERERRGWFPLVGGSLLNAAGAIASFAGHKGNGALGWIGVATGVVIAQAQFHTQPTGALRAWETYRRAGADGPLGEPPNVLRFSLVASAGPRGGSVGVTF